MPASEHSVLAVSDMARVLRGSFGRFLTQLVPRLVDAIGSGGGGDDDDDASLRQLSVGAAADICRSVDAADAQQHLQLLMPVLIDLSAADDWNDGRIDDSADARDGRRVDLETRVQLAGCFSDVCSAVGAPAFRPYVRPVVEWLRRVAARLTARCVRFANN